ncbi:MAG: hypothetical protein BAA02_13020 [Paenibacillaceae bacterium ZCTH02-B3]|nr:MAG: hypothetical protein BAA02_13020 [Paenibacillaceae bacterium ZCTH02-B3]
MIRGHAEIAGAGIAGLTVGALLAERGWTVRVHERAGEVREVGAGIFLKYNSLSVLDEMGILPKLTSYGVRLERDQMRDMHGRILQERKLNKSPMWAFTRQHLIRTLYEAAVERGVEVVTNSRVVGAKPSGELVLEDGKTLKADLVIGADGHRSRVRETLGLTHKFRFKKTFSTRYLIDGRDLQPEPMTTEWWSGRRRIAFAACAPDKTYVYLACPFDEADGNDQPLFVESWSRWFPLLTDAFRILEKNKAVQGPYPRVSVKAWSKGKAVILGDAASALAPTLGQGAGLAIMNSRALVARLERENNLQTAIEKWEQDMKKVTVLTQKWSDRYDWLTRDWPNSLMFVRSAIIHAFGYPFLNDRMRVADRWRVVPSQK